MPDSFLVVAQSARLLVQSAARAGHPVCALDLFDDADTGRMALTSRAVRAHGGDLPRFDRNDLLQSAAELCPPSHCRGLVYGSGFECDADTLAFLARGRALLGNTPQLLSRLNDPLDFFGLLDRLSIPHPPTVLARPAAPSGWLYKRRGACGGAHIVDAAAIDAGPQRGAPAAATATRGGAAAPGEGYFQKRVPGESLSILFLGDGQRAKIVGVARQLVTGTGRRPYAYAGAVGPVGVPERVRRALIDALQALVAHTGLVGCNSFDFVLDGEQTWALEINPRPSATIDLYDEDWPRGLFDAHVQACRGRMPEPDAVRGAASIRAHAIVYAGSPLQVALQVENAGSNIGANASFPAWCSDLPRPGTRVAAGAPVCTVHASAPNEALALRQLARRKRQVERMLRIGWEREGIEDERNDLAAEREPQRSAPGRVAAATAR